MYDLASKCSVLLAKDFVHNAFTVILNEETRNSRSLYVEMNQTVISIYPRLKISKMYNLSFTEENCQVLDQSLENSTMNSRQGTNKIEISDHKGVSVSCDFQYDLCTVTLAGWHHGISAGLFGTNDNEAGNEWMVPNGSFTDNVQEFTHSWQVNKCSLVPKKEKPCPITAKQNICKAFFEEPHSLLR
ncbi:APLP protein, partial [Dicrurus megarhynchus]|nr:APLP protein [Dicrurus megarhynchus]